MGNITFIYFVIFETLNVYATACFTIPNTALFVMKSNQNGALHYTGTSLRTHHPQTFPNMSYGNALHGRESSNLLRKVFTARTEAANSSSEHEYLDISEK